jgi:hypothetical protein
MKCSKLNRMERAWPRSTRRAIVAGRCRNSSPPCSKNALPPRYFGGHLGSMAIWIGGVRLPDSGFRLLAPSSGSSITMRPRSPGEWEIIPSSVFDSSRQPLLREPVRIDVHGGFEAQGVGAYVKLTPLAPGQTRSGAAPSTRPGDMQLEIKAYDERGSPAFEISGDRIIASGTGLEVQVFGPRFPAPGTTK